MTDEVGVDGDPMAALMREEREKMSVVWVWPLPFGFNRWVLALQAMRWHGTIKCRHQTGDLSGRPMGLDPASQSDTMDVFGRP